MGLPTPSRSTNAVPSSIQPMSTPSLGPSASSAAALSWFRETTEMSCTPSSASPTTAAAAVAPEPSTAARPATGPKAPLTPSMSVLSARHPVCDRTRVLAEPTSSARAVRSSANRNAANLPGIVTETPTHSGPKPATRFGNSSAVHSMRSYVQPSSPSARYAARCSCGDRECPIGDPSTAALRGLSRGIEETVALGQFDVREMLLVVAGEQSGALHVDRDEVQPVPRRGLLGRRQCRLAGRADGCGRKTRPHIGIPQRVLRAVGVGGGHLDPVQRIVHRGVKFQGPVLVQPVVDDPGDLREVIRFGLPLHQ